MGSERKLVKGAHNKARTRRHFPSSPISPPPQHQLPFPFINRKQRAAVAAPDYLLIGLRALKMNGCFSAASRTRRESPPPATHAPSPDFYCRRALRFSCLDKFSIRRQPQRRASFVFDPKLLVRRVIQKTKLVDARGKRKIRLRD
jgi:hypothetical protein